MDAQTTKEEPLTPVTLARAYQRWEQGVCALVFVVILISLALHRWGCPDLDRPLEYDEWHTVEYYGWAGLTPTGDMKLIRRMPAFEALPSPNGRQLGLGLYRAVGVWKEPNNHILHSCLVNLSTAVERSPRSVRTPAFLFGILFAVAVFILVGPVLEWWWAAPMIGVLAYSLPYVQTYGTLARGYTLVLTLQVLLIAFAVLVARRPTSIGLSTLMAALAVGCFLNVISLSIDWVFALYLAVYLFPPSGAQPGLRRNVLVQGLALGAIFGLFVLDRLPAIVLASQRFGEQIRSPSELVDWLSRTTNYLFPTVSWLALGAAGIVGLLLAGTSKSTRFVFGLAVVVFAVNLLHFVLTQRCPYPRVCGYFLPPILLGLCYLVERGVLSLSESYSRWALTGACCAVAVVLPLLNSPTVAPPASGVTLGSLDREPGIYAVVVGWDYVPVKALPTVWRTHQDDPDPGTVRWLMLIADRQEHPTGCEWNIGSTMRESPRPLPGSAVPVNDGGSFQVALVRARSWEFQPGMELPSSDLVIVCWYPNQDRIGLDPGPLMALFDEYAIAYLRRSVRLQANYDYYVRPGAFEMIAESAEERNQLQKLLGAGLSRFGGRAVVYQSIASK